MNAPAPRVSDNADMRRLVLLTLAATLPLRADLPEPARKLAAAARAQVGVTTLYDPAYVKLGYPDGDVPEDRGVCTDVVIRASLTPLSSCLTMYKLPRTSLMKNQGWGAFRL